MRKLFLSPEELRVKIFTLAQPSVPVFDVLIDAMVSHLKLLGPAFVYDDLVNYPRLIKIGETLAELTKYANLTWTHERSAHDL